MYKKIKNYCGRGFNRTTKFSNLVYGFTLLEILLVVGIIAILAGIIIIAINPGKQLAAVRNTERATNLKQIYNAMQQYYIDYSNYPATTPTELTEICDTGTATSTETVFCPDGLINLSALVPVYLVAIPIDPQGSYLTFFDKIIQKVFATTNGTAYEIMRDSNNKIKLFAPQAELGQIVSIGDPDIIAPVISAFSSPATSSSLTVTDLNFTATDNNSVSAYLLTESSTTPPTDGGGWASTPPDSYTFDSEGDKTLYLWVKDAAGNISDPVSVNVTVTSSWTCGSSIVDSRDAKSYSTVSIGSQCWMANNLNLGTVTAGINNQGTNCASVQKYCYLDNQANCDSYGGLYQWDQMMCGATTTGSTGICLSGWHVPSDVEYKTLEMYLGMTQGQADATGWRGTNEGDKLKLASSCNGRTPCGTSGFDVTAGGFRVNGGTFTGLSFNGAFWTSLEGSPTAWYRSIYFPGDTETINRDTFDKTFGLSVRCIRD